MTERILAGCALELWRASGAKTPERLLELCSGLHGSYPELDLEIIRELARAGVHRWEGRDLEYVGHAPSDSRCDCEASWCHPNGDCSREGFAIIRAYGMRQTLCSTCLRSARAVDAVAS